MLGNDFCGSQLGTVAAAADLRGQFHARHHRRITGIGGVIGGRTVAVLTLHAFELRRAWALVNPVGKSVTDRVAGQAARIGVLMNPLESREGLSVRGRSIRLNEHPA